MMPRVSAGYRPDVYYKTGHGHDGWTLPAITANQLVEHVAQSELEWAVMRSPVAALFDIPWATA